MADAGDDRGVVALVGENHATRQPGDETGDRRLVRDVAGGEQQRGIVLMQAGQLALELDVVGARARDVAGAAGARPTRADGVLESLEHDRMFAHAEVVVAAPDDCVCSSAGLVERGRTHSLGVGKAPLVTIELDEGAVAAL